jgi:amidohydrolase
MQGEYYSTAQEVREELISIRRRIHQYPEIGFCEVQTSRFIQEKLKEYGLKVQAGLAKTGVVGIIEGEPGKTILIRSDMDALPIKEENDVPYRSRIDGMMHACGHDGHVAIGLVAAKLLSLRKRSLGGSVKFIFQPAEEGPGGARVMLEEGILKDPDVDVAIGLHIWNDLPLGKIGVRSGPIFASADEFTIKVIGRGGHAGYPHQCVDPVVISAEIINLVQTIVSRKVDPLKSAVVTIGRIEGGTKHNIIPEFVTLYGTVRTFEEPIKQRIKTQLEGIVKGITSLHGASYSFEYLELCPVLINSPQICGAVHDAAAEVVGKDNVLEEPCVMGAEDMAFILREVPGAYFVVGSANPSKGFAYPHHSPRFDFDEEALLIGLEVILRTVEKL